MRPACAAAALAAVLTFVALRPLAAAPDGPEKQLGEAAQAGQWGRCPELMRELAKVVNVTRKRAANMAAGPMPVSVVLVIDAATGQNGLNQALEFNEALGLDGIIMTKLDGTAKGGIAMAVAERLKLPILRVGVGEQVDDLQEFNAKDFCRALVGESN